MVQYLGLVSDELLTALRVKGPEANSFPNLEEVFHIGEEALGGRMWPA